MCEECGCRNNNDVVVLKVEGMSCAHCKNSVEKAVGALPGVTKAEVSLEEKIVTVSFDPDILSLDQIRNAITDIGFDVI